MFLLAVIINSVPMSCVKIREAMWENIWRETETKKLH